MEELDRMVRDTISELTGLLGNTKSFYKKLKSGRLDDGDNFMDFTPPMEEHTSFFPEDAQFLAISRNPRDQEAYEADVIRVQLIDPADLNDE